MLKKADSLSDTNRTNQVYSDITCSVTIENGKKREKPDACIMPYGRARRI